MNVASGTFGTWHETATNIHLAIYGRRSTDSDTAARWADSSLKTAPRSPRWLSLPPTLRREPAHPLASARADLLRAMREQSWPEGRIDVEHRWKHASILCQAFRHGVPLTVHPGHRLRHHFQPSGVQRRGDRAGRRMGFQALRRLGRAARRGRRALGRLGHHGTAGVREDASVASTTCGCKMAKASWAAIRSSSSTFRTAAAGTGRRENRPKRTPPITCGFAKAILGWGEPCTICNATMSAFIHNLYHALLAAG